MRFDQRKELVVTKRASGLLQLEFVHKLKISVVVLGRVEHTYASIRIYEWPK